MNRLVQPNDLPDSLWHQGDQVLTLPPSLVSAYIAILERHDLRTMADQPSPNPGPVGGITKPETDTHLAWGFAGSAARIELAFAQLFSGNKVAIADVPCGSGAAVLSILTTLAELRQRGCVPREPLDVVVIGGEISPFARNYAVEGISEIKTTLESQAIWVQEAFFNWDVCDILSNTDLIREITIRSRDSGARMLVVANFSGFLQRQGKFNAAKPQLEELFRHYRGTQCSAIWVEPQAPAVNNLAGGFFPRVNLWLAETWARFIHLFDTRQQPTSGAQASCLSRHPLKPELTPEVRLSVMRFDLNSN